MDNKDKDNNAYVSDFELPQETDDDFTDIFDEDYESNVEKPDTETVLLILKKFSDNELRVLIKHFQKYENGNEIDKSKVKRRRFNNEEDEKLKSIVEYVKEKMKNEIDNTNTNNTNNESKLKLSWQIIAALMGNGFSSRQCKERYTKYLNPEISSLPWTKSEDEKLLSLCQQCGTKWSILAKYFPNRTDINIKNRWITIMRRKAKQKAFMGSK